MSQCGPASQVLLIPTEVHSIAYRYVYSCPSVIRDFDSLMTRRSSRLTHFKIVEAKGIVVNEFKFTIAC
jgi:hypothetical protein